MLKFKKCHLQVLLVALICCGGFLGVIKKEAKALNYVYHCADTDGENFYAKGCVIATIDPDNEVNESNENNNTFTKTINIGVADMDICTAEYSPVCGADNKIYSNGCEAKKAGADVVYKGECKGSKDSKIEKIANTAQNLSENKFDQILAEIKVLKDIIREQQVEIKYLKTLKQDVKKLSAAVESAINNFITYGVDENTKKLGEGERAAVMHSYKAAFDKLPETEEELSDAIKIANGRWPSITNETAENKAKEQFQKIYKRIPNMEDGKDNAAVTVMAYGLRQRAENRNLNSEKAGINIFKGIYKKLPQTTEEWNIMQAITYSGAAREQDTDGDLLPDWREEEIGTDKTKKDTDGDGYTDGSEVLNGFDPLEK